VCMNGCASLKAGTVLCSRSASPSQTSPGAGTEGKGPWFLPPARTRLSGASGGSLSFSLPPSHLLRLLLLLLPFFFFGTGA
jgi:hypothetical protein